jgi:olfactory receptor
VQISIFCDPFQLFNLAFSDTFTRKTITHFVATVLGLLSISSIFYSYYKIISSIFRIPSTGSKFKAFFTCVFHLSVICLFCGTAFGVYFGSALLPSPKEGYGLLTVVNCCSHPYAESIHLQSEEQGH